MSGMGLAVGDVNHDGLPDAFISMGETAENVANSRGITREQMDQYAFESQQRAAQAAADGFWARDIVPVTRADGSVVSTDDSPRPGTTLEGLAALTPSFRPDGSITCWGNSAFGQQDTPPGTYVQVAAHNYFTCAVTTDNEFRCWGDGSNGQTTPPTR